MSLDTVRADWTRLGAQDPLWAVLVSPVHRNGAWDVAEFLATGRGEIEQALARVRELGLTPGHSAALDFGCGVGRLTQALAGHVDRAVGVDISPTMLERARELSTLANVEFVLNERADLARFDSAAFDIVYSSLVLQHLPTPLARTYLAELLRVLRPGGALVIQVATAPDRSAKGLLFRYAPRWALRFAQRRILRYPAPMDMNPFPRADVDAVAAAAGATVLAADDDPMYGGHWRYARYFLTR